MRVGILLAAYPVLNETFVSRELFELQKQGVKGIIYTEEMVRMSASHPFVGEIRFPVKPIYTVKKTHRNLPAFFISHFEHLMRSPKKYLSATFLLFRHFSYNNARFFLWAGFLAARMGKDKLDLLYVHDAEGIGAIGLFCHVMSGIPSGIIFHTKGLFVDTGLLKEKIFRNTFCIFQSSFSKHLCVDRYRLAPQVAARCMVIPLAGVDTGFFTPPKIYKKSHTITIVTVCRLEEMKGLPALLSAVHTLKKKGIPVACDIIGYGSKEGELRSLSQRLDLDHEVYFRGAMGHTPVFRDALRNAEFFILPSRVDTAGDRDMQPNAVKEAMSVGCIVITTRLGGTDEVVHDGKNGFLLSSPTPESIVEKVIQVWKFSEKRKREIRSAARHEIVTFHNSTRVVGGLVRVFQRFRREKK